MNKVLGYVAVSSFALALYQAKALPETLERSQVPIQETWNLQDIYASEEAWSEAKGKLAARLKQILEYKGKLAASASGLLGCLDLNSRVLREFARLHNYAAMKADEDTRNLKYLAMRQEIEQLLTDYNSNASFIEPEVAAVGKTRIDRFIVEKPALRIYKMYLYDIQRTKVHRLSEKEEKILAETSLVANGPSSIYTILSNAELPYPQIKLSDGTTALLTKAGYSRYRAAVNRNDREAVFQAFWQAIDSFKGTFGVGLYANVRKDIFYARARGYESSLERALDKDNIPTQVYSALIENVRNNLASFHRYLNLKKRMLGVDVLKYSDIYAPAVKGVDLAYKFDEAKRLVLDSVKPLGPDYCRAAAKTFEERWIDVHPTPGKLAGAYSNGSIYDVHPYILLNYNGQYDDVSTLAHELGHAMHSYYANKTQPYPTADYSTFVAEVASTFNEALLIGRMLAEIKDEPTRLSLLMNHLEGIRQTVFRQTQFAEFELRMHEKAERGEPLTADVLSKLYGDILKEYYGHDKAVCQIDELYAVEWAYIPHFYSDFYVYQYSTSFTASTALAEGVLRNREGAAEKYIEFLSAGGADYPVDLLRKAGVDMTTAEPFGKTMAAMNRTMDEIEVILNKTGG